MKRAKIVPVEVIDVTCRPVKQARRRGFGLGAVVLTTLAVGAGVVIGSMMQSQDVTAIAEAPLTELPAEREVEPITQAPPSFEAPIESAEAEPVEEELRTDSVPLMADHTDRDYQYRRAGLQYLGTALGYERDMDGEIILVTTENRYTADRYDTKDVVIGGTCWGVPAMRQLVLKCE